MGSHWRMLRSGRTVRVYFRKIRIEEGRTGPVAVNESREAEGFN